MTPTRERRRYEQFCPVARSLDLLGERWTLLVVRDLLTGPQRFTDLRDQLPGVAPALLTQRLRDLEAAGYVRRTELPPPAARTVYELTDHGRALEPIVYELARFGLRLLDDPPPDGVAPHLLALGVKALVKVEALPRRAFRAHLVLDEGDLTLRIEPPGDARPLERVSVTATATAANVTAGPADRADATVRGAVAGILLVRQGHMTWAEARAAGVVDVEGPARAVDTVRALFGLA